MPKDKMMISYCGICCTLCPRYTSKQCPGCKRLKGCKIVVCAEKREVKCCFLCKEFPCKLYKKGFDWNLDRFRNLKKHRIGVVRWTPYSEKYVMLFGLGKKKK